MSEDFPQHHIVDLNDKIRINGTWYQVKRPDTDPLATPFLMKLPQDEQNIPEYVQNNIRDLNYFLVMLTDISEIYRKNPTMKNMRFTADNFSNVMASVLGYQQLGQASRTLASALRHKGCQPSFVPEEEPKYE